jgi:hypothetical protein
VAGIGAEASVSGVTALCEDHAGGWQGGGRQCPPGWRGWVIGRITPAGGLLGEAIFNSER